MDVGCFSPDFGSRHESPRLAPVAISLGAVNAIVTEAGVEGQRTKNQTLRYEGRGQATAVALLG